jgi:hypothetical protein
MKRGPTDPDHHAAWVACGEPAPPLFDGEPIDLRAKLAAALEAGWTIQALKAFAHGCWRYTGRDHVTPAAWRMAVLFSDEGVLARPFLAQAAREREAAFAK